MKNSGAGLPVDWVASNLEYKNWFSPSLNNISVVHDWVVISMKRFLGDYKIWTYENGI